jgi:hypothetical protein
MRAVGRRVRGLDEVICDPCGLIAHAHLADDMGVGRGAKCPRWDPTAASAGTGTKRV